MQPFVHLHVHTHYSILDGQASIPALVDKAMHDGMRGMAVTDHGNMFGIKEFYNYVNKKNGKTKAAISELKKKIEEIKNRTPESSETSDELEQLQEELKSTEAKIFKPVINFFEKQN